ncbi:MAG: hypothetical protein GXX96_31440 [Planctomycetaceae bacterium]|nr:hypothetical protein [Planctomycetaceae bacterium]
MVAPIDPRRLRPTDALRLLNSAGYGTVLTETQLRRHRNRAGFQIGDGRTVDLFRYTAWLTHEYLAPKASALSYEEQKRRQAERNAEAVRSGQDIGQIPAVVDPERKERAEASFQFFCEAYFPEVFYLPWSADHRRVIEKIERAVLSGGLFAMAMPRGSGKALALDTPLVTPFGWTTMGEVQVGDWLFDESGHVCRVTYATPVMFGRPCYCVSFSDGEEIVCDGDHLWTVYDRYSRRNPLTLTTAEMAFRVDLSNKRGRSEKRYRIPLAAPLQIPAVNLPIAPYSLGVWLGDGTSRSATVTLAEWDYPEISDQIRWSGELFSLRSVEPDAHTCTGILTRTHSIKTSFQGRLRKLGLLQNKHVPAQYLRADYSQRLELLQGLLDTDGHVSNGGKCEIIIKYPKLADDFGELLSSLGIKYGRGVKYVDLNGIAHGPYHRFHFTVHSHMAAFLLRRKQARLRPLPSTRPLSGSRQIVAIKPIDSVAVRCIQVDSPSHLYLAGRKMVPTHNTVLCQTAVLWSALTGATPFVTLIAASAERAHDLLENIKTWLETNELLYEDWPEVVHPIRQLERITNRQKGQKHEGEPTRIEWASDKIVLPTIRGSKASGVVVSSSGMKGSDIRGQNHARPDGQVVRPQLVMVDDPQTTESAWSPSQSQRREAILAGDVLGMAGPGKKIAGLMACTVIRPGDMADNILDRQKHPEWQGERTKLVYSFPTNEKLWARYAEIRADSLRNDGDGSEATEFYRRNRTAMDAGAVIAWPERHNVDELSAIQHAMNLRLRDETAFFAEYQNEPVVAAEGEEMLTAEEIAAKLDGYRRGEIPLGCNHLTMFVDVQGKALFWLIAAWEDSFSGHVVDYGTWPDQKRDYFTLRDMRATLGRATPGAGMEGAIYAGLERLCDERASRVYRREDGAEMKVDRVLVDANWGQSTDVVYQFCRQSSLAGILLPSHGKYVGASSVPFSEYKRRRGDRIGHHWRIPNTTGRRQVRHVLIDTNYWKTFVHARLAVAMGDPGSLSLFGRDENTHRLLAEHLTAEYRVRTTARDRVVDEWKSRAHRPDNHWLDCLVGCAVAASIQGAVLFGTEATSTPKRERVSFAELQRRKRG